MQVLKSQRNYAFDMIKCIAAFLVVCIHYAPKYNLFDAYLNAICRIAVPLFFIITGYYYENRVASGKVKQYVQRIAWLTFYASLFYLIAFSIEHYFDGNLIQWLRHIFCLKNLCKWFICNDYPVVSHLWYLYALIYSVAFNVVVDKLKLTKFLPYLCVGLLFLHCVLNVKFSGIYLRNWMFMGVPFLIVGRILNQIKEFIYKINLSAITIVIILFISLLLLYLEMMILPYRDFYASIIPLVLTISMLAIRYPLFGEDSFVARIGKEYSSDLYLYHVFIGGIIISCINNNSVCIWYLRPVVITVLTTIFSFIITLVKRNYVIFKR